MSTVMSINLDCILYLRCSSGDMTLLAGIIVLEEFCKELAAIAFIKHYYSGTIVAN